ncbi:MAG TPA: CoA ester lyase [Burkholderiales bacterium]|nr:CoA ester lyase [Burkholderiales bacterium]
MRARRSCLSVPGSSPKFLAKAATLDADEVFFDLEDSVAPLEKEAARGNVVQALKEHEYKARTKVLRVNGVYTRWCAKDLTEVVENAGEQLDCIMIPKVETVSDVKFVSNMLRMIEENMGFDKRIGIEVQIETALGLLNLPQIAACDDRIEDLILGPADMSASLGLPTVTAGEAIPGYENLDHFHYVLTHINIAARANNLQAIGGPFLLIRDLDGFRAAAMRERALGYDGKWALHPDQVAVLNEVFSPTQDEFDKAESVLEHYKYVTEVERKGAVMFGKEMIDEASRKMAEQFAARGRAAGMTRVKQVKDFLGE